MSEVPSGGPEHQEPVQGGASSSGCLKPALILIVLAAIVFMAFASCKPSSRPVDNGRAAQSACEEWVKDQLKAPSTAVVGGVERSGSGPWTVIGWVDAQNSFGAMIRTRWTCSVRLEGDMFRGRATLLQ